MVTADFEIKENTKVSTYIYSVSWEDQLIDHKVVKNDKNTAGKYFQYKFGENEVSVSVTSSIEKLADYENGIPVVSIFKNKSKY